MVSLRDKISGDRSAWAVRAVIMARPRVGDVPPATATVRVGMLSMSKGQLCGLGDDIL